MIDARTRRRTERWITAVGLTLAAEDAVVVDVPATNAIGLLSAHAAIELVLGLLVGPTPDSRRDESFGELLKNAEAVKAGNPITAQLHDDLHAAHRTRNAVVHSHSVVHHDEVERAVEAARELLDVFAADLGGLATPTAGGIGHAVAEAIQTEAVGMWLREAELRLERGEIESSAAAAARALASTEARTSPDIRRSLGRWPTWSPSTAPSRPGDPDDRARYLHDRALQQAFGSVDNRIDALEAWTIPLALGLRPAGYRRLRGVVGIVAGDVGGHPQPVHRVFEELPTARELRWAIGTIAGVAYRLWATGSLMEGPGDDHIVGLARPTLLPGAAPYSSPGS